jgi:hypothetical protein
MNKVTIETYTLKLAPDHPRTSVQFFVGSGTRIEIGMTSAEWNVLAMRILAAGGASCAPFIKLFSKLFEHFVADGMIDLDYGDFQEWAGEAGLLEPVNYDPAQHGELDAEPGDIIYVLTPTARAAMDAAERTEP